MTIVSIDDRVSELLPEPGVLVSDVVALAMAQLSSDRVLLGIALNGKHVPKHAENDAFDRSTDECDEVAIRTADRHFWARSGLDMALSSLERMHSSIVRTAGLFHDGKIPEGNRVFVKCLEGLERFLENIVVSRNALNLDFSTVMVEGDSLQKVEREFLQILRGIVKSQHAHDYVAIADRMEYELLTNLSSWTKALRMLRAAAHSHA